MSLPAAVLALLRVGVAVLAYDTRGVGRSGGVFLRQRGDSAEAVLTRLAADAALAMDFLVSSEGVDTSRVGYFGASQAGWIIPLAAQRRELEARVLAYREPTGYDLATVLARSTVPTLWLLGERDQSVPTFASRRVLDSLANSGRGAHTVISFPNADHSLRDADGGPQPPVWDAMLSWLQAIGVVSRGP